MHSIRNFFNDYLNSIRQSQFLKRTLVSYLSVSFILFIIFSLLISRHISADYRNNVIAMNHKTMLQSSDITANVLSNVYNYTENLFNNDENLLSIMYGKKFTSELSMKKAVLTASLNSFSNVLDSFYIINLDSGYICSSYGTYYSPLDFFDQDIIQDLQNDKLDKRHSYFVPRKIPAPQAKSNQEYLKVISLIYVMDNAHAFVVNIDQEKYASMAGAGADSDIQTIVLNSNNLCLVHSDSQQFASDYSGSPLVKKIHSSASHSGNMIQKLDGANYFISYLRDDYFGFTYIILTRKYLFNINSPLVVNTFVYSFIFIILTVILSLLLSWITYHPVHNIKQNLQLFDTVPPDVAENDVSGIPAAIHAIHHSYDTMTRRITTYEHTQARDLLKQFLEGSLDYTAFKNRLGNLPIHLDGPAYLVVMVSFDKLNQLTANNENIDLMRYAIINIGSELLEPHYSFELSDNEIDKITFVINTHNFNRELLRHIFSELKERYREYFGITLSVGVSNFTEKLSDVPVSYHNAYTALQHRLVTGKESLNFYDQLHFLPPDKQFYPFDEEKELLSSVKSSLEFNLENNIQAFFDAMEHYSDNLVLLYILRLNSAIERMEFSNDITITIPFIDSFALSSLTIEELKPHFVSRCSNIIQICLSRREQSSEKEMLISNVKQYVEEHLYDTDLSVSAIAKEVHLSVNYLRSIFKENTGLSLSSYITEQKLELICNLLKETDMPIQEISDKLGFTTRNYFFTFFKKHKGVTPTQYRNDIS